MRIVSKTCGGTGTSRCTLRLWLLVKLLPSLSVPFDDHNLQVPELGHWRSLLSPRNKGAQAQAQQQKKQGATAAQKGESQEKTRRRTNKKRNPGHRTANTIRKQIGKMSCFGVRCGEAFHLYPCFFFFQFRGPAPHTHEIQKTNEKRETTYETDCCVARGHPPLLIFVSSGAWVLELASLTMKFALVFSF